MRSGGILETPMPPSFQRTMLSRELSCYPRSLPSFSASSPVLAGNRWNTYASRVFRANFGMHEQMKRTATATRLMREKQNNDFAHTHTDICFNESTIQIRMFHSHAFSKCIHRRGVCSPTRHRMIVSMTCACFS